ncbi:MAG: carboxypeptidase-like regulatory domain-containing protein [Planctomycetia bacterium]|nr:carboxypeptidase-like regulatory domain-containing protein [Planctomycetia bacterium]
MRIRSILLGALLLVFLSLPLGCGPAKPPSGTITGTVKLDGVPVPLGQVNFINTDMGVRASADIDSTGKYEILKDQIRVGKYTVTVLPPEIAPMEKPPENLKDFKVPKKFQDDSRPIYTVEIKEGKNTYDLDLKSK